MMGGLVDISCPTGALNWHCNNKGHLEINGRHFLTKAVILLAMTATVWYPLYRSWEYDVKGPLHPNVKEAIEQSQLAMAVGNRNSSLAAVLHALLAGGQRSGAEWPGGGSVGEYINTCVHICVHHAELDMGGNFTADGWRGRAGEEVGD